MKNRVAIVGAGMTLFRRRMLESPKELSFEATRMALDSAGLELKDIQSGVSGSAPDAFDGMHMKGEYLLDGMGAIGKPHERVYVGGGTGVFTPIGGWWNVASGLYDTCLCVAEEKMSPLHPHPQYAFWSIFDQILERPLGTTLLWIFSLEMRRYMHKYGIKEEEIAEVAVKNKGNAVDHPCAQLGANITVDDVMRSEPICEPVKRLDVSPPSDGAAAVILASEKIAKKLTDQPVWLDGVGWTIDSTHWTNRDLAYPEYVEKAAKMAYKMAGIKNPRKEIKYLDVVYKFEARYSWAAGVAISRFLTELKDGRIVARKCYKCQRILVPPRMYCEQCFRPTDEWVHVKDTGTVNTFSISHVGTDARRLKTPILVSVVDIDGASPGMGILHNLGEVEPSKISVGMTVQAVWKRPEERQGSITDIGYFKPIESI